MRKKTEIEHSSILPVCPSLYWIEILSKGLFKIKSTFALMEVSRSMCVMAWNLTMSSLVRVAILNKGDITRVIFTSNIAIIRYSNIDKYWQSNCCCHSKSAWNIHELRFSIHEMKKYHFIAILPYLLSSYCSSKLPVWHGPIRVKNLLVELKFFRSLHMQIIQINYEGFSTEQSAVWKKNYQLKITNTAKSLIILPSSICR